MPLLCRSTEQPRQKSMAHCAQSTSAGIASQRPHTTMPSDAGGAPSADTCTGPPATWRRPRRCGAALAKHFGVLLLLHLLLLLVEHEAVVRAQQRLERGVKRRLLLDAPLIVLFVQKAVADHAVELDERQRVHAGLRRVAHDKRAGRLRLEQRLGLRTLNVGIVPHFAEPRRRTLVAQRRRREHLADLRLRRRRREHLLRRRRRERRRRLADNRVVVVVGVPLVEQRRNVGGRLAHLGIAQPAVLRGGADRRRHVDAFDFGRTRRGASANELGGVERRKALPRRSGGIERTANHAAERPDVGRFGRLAGLDLLGRHPLAVLVAIGDQLDLTETPVADTCTESDAAGQIHRTQLDTAHSESAVDNVVGVQMLHRTSHIGGKSTTISSR
jgi:hypothetical protein